MPLKIAIFRGVFENAMFLAATEQRLKTRGAFTRAYSGNGYFNKIARFGQVAAAVLVLVFVVEAGGGGFLFALGLSLGKLLLDSALFDDFVHLDVQVLVA